MYDVAALGELLIDFTPAGNYDPKSPVFQQNAGGAPANVLASLSRLGGSGAFLGMAGDDPFGRFLKTAMEDSGVDMAGLRFTEKAHTTLAFVHLDEHGDRHFSFYGLPGADRMLTPQDLKLDLIADARVFHFGALSLAGEMSAKALKSALSFAKDRHKIISYDPNWRPALWKNEREAKNGMRFGLQYADIVKLSEDELEFLTGEKGPAAGTERLIRQGASIVFVTQGPDGCFFRCRKGMGHRNTYDTPVVDTTGSGDTFFGAALFCLTRSDVEIRSVDAEQLGGIVDFANAAGALCASHKGAFAGMPTVREIENCRRTVPRLVRR
ncbi:MAG: carbohydrate kinase [Oscillospiraceae bacterium]|jgi:fructokinase|nr:carbohydrate kinase [Oscillospiraceae bacterium]MCI1990332.1 carbohydrate kinase [Oscillospiraceae bacterium]